MRGLKRGKGKRGLYKHKRRGWRREVSESGNKTNKIRRDRLGGRERNRGPYIGDSKKFVKFLSS